MSNRSADPSSRSPSFAPALLLAVAALILAACASAAPAAPATAPVATQAIPPVSTLPPAATAAPSTRAIASPAVTSLPAEVTVAEAAGLRDQGAFVLDVRQSSEWVDGHVPGATLIPLDQLPSRLGEVPRDRPVVVICRSGNRSAQGRDILLDAGFPAVTSVGGGMRAWEAARLPIKTGP